MAYSVGIEEEHFIVERDSAALALNGPRSDAVYRISEDAGCSKHEQFLCQVELNTRRCDSVDEAIDCVRALRANANALLEREGFALLGAGVHPMGVEPGASFEALRTTDTRTPIGRVDRWRWQRSPAGSTCMWASTASRRFAQSAGSERSARCWAQPHAQVPGSKAPAHPTSRADRCCGA